VVEEWRRGRVRGGLEGGADEHIDEQWSRRPPPPPAAGWEWNGDQRGLGLGARAQYTRIKRARWACVGWRPGGLLSLFGPRAVRRHMLGFQVCIYFNYFGSSALLGVKTEAEAEAENRST
jgi:hypothetical protein